MTYLANKIKSKCVFIYYQFIFETPYLVLTERIKKIVSKTVAMTVRIIRIIIKRPNGSTELTKQKQENKGGRLELSENLH